MSKRLAFQNVSLLLASYVFYGSWDYRFLFLLVFSTLLDYATAIQISNEKNDKLRKFWFWLSICINLGLLVVFKYYNFFLLSFQQGLTRVGIAINPSTLNLVLPVGISFYTFHGISYIIDVYKGKTKASKNFIEYALFVCFFPLLVAGPIERATHLLPQLKRERRFVYDSAVDGCKQILWGFFKKIVIADNCAIIVNEIFEKYPSYHGSTLIVGAFLFAVQIYCDFSGYSDIAVGTARLFGIDLLRNFAFPYFSRDIAEFWRRWHISLSSWFRDYVYIPLGGSKGGKFKTARNVFVIFIVSGFWHGSNWTFIVWGLLNAIYILPSVMLQRNRDHLEIVAKGKKLPTLKETVLIAFTFMLTVLAWIFFRSQSVSAALDYLLAIFSISNFMPFDGRVFLLGNTNMTALLGLIGIFFIIEWLGREYKYAIENISFLRLRIFRWAIYYSIICLLFFFQGKQQGFIYFQF
jgi:alginate O-acetyltransferase complex protein AlgI